MNGLFPIHVDNCGINFTQPTIKNELLNDYIIDACQHNNVYNIW